MSTDTPEEEKEKLALPDQKALEKEIGDYLSNKYGDKIKIVTAGILPHAADEKLTVAQDAAGGSPVTFDLKPEELIAYLDEYIVGQNRAKDVLATKVCTHFNRIRYKHQKDVLSGRDFGRIKNNILLVGPTGVGKTFLIKLIAEKLGVPFVKGDATKFSETGYVGGDVDDLVRDLVREAGDSIELAQYGIIYVDEIDKIASGQGRGGLDVSRSGVQRALLKPMEETEIDLKVPHDMISQIEAVEHFRATGEKQKRLVNTKNILFIMSGAFDGLGEIIRKRLHKQSIGFAGQVVSAGEDNDYLPKVKSEDLVQFGFETEFIGRLPITATLDMLSAADFEEILNSPNCSIIIAKKQDFMVYGITICFEKDALAAIALKAIAEKTGARGLVSVIENILLPFEKTLPSTKVNYLPVTADLVADPEKILKKTISNRQFRNRCRQRCEAVKEDELVSLVAFFRHRKENALLEMGVSVSDERLALMARMTQDENTDPASVCECIVQLVNHIEDWQQTVYNEYGQQIILDDSAVDYMLAQQPPTVANIDKMCGSIFESLEYGLKLLQQKGYSDEIFLSKAALKDTDNFINNFIADIFKL